MKNIIEKCRAKRGFICDMDGVIYHGNKILPGAKDFVQWLKDEGKKFLFLTNSSERTPSELSLKLKNLGINVSKEHFYTSALATAIFLKSQKPGGTAYVIGEAGLINALHDAGYTIDSINPDYVVVGESSTYSYEKIIKAVNFVKNGARLIGTNPDTTGPIENGIAPATKALIAPIEIATEKMAYYIGKPNPLMMRHALKILNCQREETLIIGDRMDTDIIAGIESEIETLLVLSGITSKDNIKNFAYFPDFILKGVADLTSTVK